MRGICIDTGSTTVLQEGQKYYLFEHGPNNFYVSKFDNPNAHMGSYRRAHFKLVEDEPQKEPPQPSIRLKRFVAQVARHRNGYRIGELFIITEKGPNGYYHVYLKDRPAGAPVGSYITDFFEIITEYDEIEKAAAAKPPERPELAEQEPPQPKPLPKAAEAKNKPKTKPKRAVAAEPSDMVVKPEQMSIFDFLEG